MPISLSTTIIFLYIYILDELIAFEHMADRTSSDAIHIVENLNERVLNAFNMCASLHVPSRRQSFYKLWWSRSWTYVNIILLFHITYGELVVSHIVIQ